MRIVLFLIISVLVFDRLTAKYKDSTDYTLDLYVGKKGSGKTTILTSLAIKYLKLGREVYSNYEIPGCHCYDSRFIGKYDFPENSVILLDEVGLAFNSRDFKNFEFNKIEWFKLQRHHKCKVILATQSPTDFDKILRELVDHAYLCKKMLRVFIMVRPVGKRLNINNNNVGDNAGGQFVFEYFFNGLPSIVFIPRWVPFFDSFSVPQKKALINSKYIAMSDTSADLATLKGYLKFKISEFYQFMKKSIIKLKALTNRKELHK